MELLPFAAGGAALLAAGAAMSGEGWRWRAAAALAGAAFGVFGGPGLLAALGLAALFAGRRAEARRREAVRAAPPPRGSMAGAAGARRAAAEEGP